MPLNRTVKMFDYLTIHQCPYCKPGEGLILVDLPSCCYARSEDPDPRYLERNRLLDQDLLRTGSRPTRWEPCRHLIRAEGKVRWDFRRDRDRRGEEEREGDGDEKKWAIEFFWPCPALDSDSFNHAGALLRDHDVLRRTRPDLLPDTIYEWTRRVHVFGDADEYRIFEGLDECELNFLVAKKPKLFLKQLSAAGYAYNALLKEQPDKKQKGNKAN